MKILNETSQEDVIKDTEVKVATSSRQVFEGITDGINTLSTADYFKFYNFYGFSYSTTDKDCLSKPYPWDMKGSDFEFDSDINKYVIDNKHPASFEIPELERSGIFTFSFNIQRTTQFTKVKVSVIFIDGNGDHEEKVIWKSSEATSYTRGSFFSASKIDEETVLKIVNNDCDCKMYLKFSSTSRSGSYSVNKFSVLEAGKLQEI